MTLHTRGSAWEQNKNIPRSVYIRLPPQLAVALDAAASEADLSRAGWVRRELARALPEGSELVSLPPSPPRRPAVIPPADLAEVSRLSAAIARTGGAVVQLCKHLRETGHVAHADAEAVLADLRSAQVEVACLVQRIWKASTNSHDDGSFLSAIVEHARFDQVEGALRNLDDSWR
uniref:Uncharacterized protein n=1 Tax=Bosea sp. NBC_00436 TaxID=2969620 RepID=A0A9E7ZLL7_9HYPH